MKFSEMTLQELMQLTPTFKCMCKEPVTCAYGDVCFTCRKHIGNPTP